MSDIQESLSLVVKEFKLGSLVTNAKGILAAVRARLAEYTVENYSGERVQEAKADRAVLNATAKVLNDQRLEYERRWMQPFEEFKAVVAETCGEIKKASTAIDSVIKGVEQAEKEEKLKQIAEYFSSLKCELFTLPQVFSPQWLNKTYSMNLIKAEIIARIDKVKEELLILERLGEPEAREQYLSTLDLTLALAAADRIKANRERLAVVEKAPPAPPVPETYEDAMETIWTEAPVAPAPQSTPVITYTLRISGTAAALRDLRLYMGAHDITYEKIEEVTNE